MLQEQEQQQIRVFKTFLQLTSKAERSQAENRCKVCREARRNLHYLITILKINVILIKLIVLL